MRYFLLIFGVVAAILVTIAATLVVRDRVVRASTPRRDLETDDLHARVQTLEVRVKGLEDHNQAVFAAQCADQEAAMENRLREAEARGEAPHMMMKGHGARHPKDTRPLPPPTLPANPGPDT